MPYAELYDRIRQTVPAPDFVVMRRIREEKLPKKPFINSSEKAMLWSLCEACWKFDPRRRIDVHEILNFLNSRPASSLITPSKRISLFKPGIVEVPEFVLSRGWCQKGGDSDPNLTDSLEATILQQTAGLFLSPGTWKGDIRPTGNPRDPSVISKPMPNIFDTVRKLLDSPGIPSLIISIPSSSFSFGIPAQSLIPVLEAMSATKSATVRTPTALTVTTVGQTVGQNSPSSETNTSLQIGPTGVDDKRKFEFSMNTLPVSLVAHFRSITQRSLVNYVMLSLRALSWIMIGIVLLLGLRQMHLIRVRWKDWSAAQQSHVCFH